MKKIHLIDRKNLKYLLLPARKLSASIVSESVYCSVVLKQTLLRKVNCAKFLYVIKVPVRYRKLQSHKNHKIQ